MPDPDAQSETNRADAEPEVADAVATTESYETDDGVVFYDAERPLGWIQARGALDLDEMA